MAISVSELARLLNEARKEITELKSRPPEVVERIVDRMVVSDKPPIVTQSPPVTIEVERIVYVDNPALIETIAALKEKLCQFTSQ